eukprot:87734_1
MSAMSAINVIDELINKFRVIKQFNYDPTNDTLMPALKTNPYSLQCFIDWVYNIEQNDKIIELDFEKIEKDIQQLKANYNLKCKGLFYPNWRPFKYTFDYDSYKAKHYNRTIYEKNKKYIQSIYFKLFANTESIIHYILSNKSFLFKLPQPDFDRKQQKLDNIIKINGDSMIKLNMKQSIYILRLLLFKYQIISPNSLYRDGCTIIDDIEETMRQIIIENTFIFPEIKKLYLDLLIDIYSISTNDTQKAIINIFTEEEVNDESKDTEISWYHVNFFDTCAVRDYGKDGRSPAKISLFITNELLFRGIPPFQIINRKHLYDYEIETYQYLNINEQAKLFQTCFHNTIEKIYASKNNYDYFDARTPTIPFFICDIAKLAKKKMYDLLDDCLKGLLTEHCVHCILDFVYMNWNNLLPNIDNENMIVKVGIFLNYIAELNLEEMDENERKKIFDDKYLTKPFARFLFVDLDEWTQEGMIKYVFVCESDNINNFGMKVLYELTRFVPLSDKILNIFIHSAMQPLRGPYMDEEGKNLFVDIVSSHIFDDEILENELFMKEYRSKIVDYIGKLYNIVEWRQKVDMKDKFMKYIINDNFPSDFLNN